MSHRKGRGLNGTMMRFTMNSWKTLFLAVFLLALATTTLLLDQIFHAKLRPVRLVRGLPMGHNQVLERIVEQQSTGKLVELPNIAGLVSVRDIVAFPDEVMLLVETVGGSAPRKDSLECLFGRKYSSEVFTVEWNDDMRSILAVRCGHPQEEILESEFNEATLRFRETDLILPSSAEYLTNSSWKDLVYESVTVADSVILFAKGLVNSQGKPDNYSDSLDQLNCRFGPDVKTSVIVIAQEVVRCKLPPVHVQQQLRGAKVSLFVPKRGVLPSVARFEPPPPFAVPPPTDEKKFHICACTMLWNQAPFLQEWIQYHGYLGIERWFLYDNNSDDDIEEVLDELQRDDYNVSRHVWPWVKTQEAGFSHCALRAKADCKWVLFADVDEFVFPLKDLKEMVSPNSTSKMSSKKFKDKPLEIPEHGVLDIKKRTTVLRDLIARTLKKGLAAGKVIGEVRLMCHNFGPSGRTSAPEEGVMMGYTCRMQWPQRHKSFILLDAMSDSLMNVVHHFSLRPGYKEMAVHSRVAVINHYKYQSWDVFKAKYVRRVATYVVDWREQTANSNDRAPGLGLEDVEPVDWSSRYCEEADWGLRNFTWNSFRNPRTHQLPWPKTDLLSHHKSSFSKR